jgi:dihydropteroate synthase
MFFTMGLKDTLFSVKQTINCHGTVMDLVTPRVMGILNITPDSFYDGGKHKTDKDILTHVEQMLSEGADIIDVGGYSSRPFADNISEKEEKSRLTYALKLIRKEFPAILISVDTFRSQIARYVVSEYGAGIINDISAGLIDDKMFAVIAELRVPYILMHMKGTPGNMQKNPVYTDVVKELLAFFSERIKTARDAGINDIIIDPGFGFGKTAGDNFRLLHELRLFEMLGYPVMAGLSRKSMVYRSLGVTPDDALNGTVILQTLALNNGAVLLRVHDVKQAVEAVKLIRLYKDSIV